MADRPAWKIIKDIVVSGIEEDLNSPLRQHKQELARHMSAMAAAKIELQIIEQRGGTGVAAEIPAMRVNNLAH